ncbi:unnamed protein product [Pseudo-nitzschia multistriata]|uniref:SUEL-type lectin domain-containing protein n=1 Tax=Pseudo-nitzschia multistriata TaxID=183589 RepID=A0A448YZ21_9STRA|nr:unnamed protein product [Pseudo-nitzschia multistriata]
MKLSVCNKNNNALLVALLATSLHMVWAVTSMFNYGAQEECSSVGGIWEPYPSQSAECTGPDKEILPISLDGYGNCLNNAGACALERNCTDLPIAAEEIEDLLRLTGKEGYTCNDSVDYTEGPEAEADPTNVTTIEPDPMESAAPLVGAFASASITVGMAVAMIL